jgi:hypothetical protein
MITLFENFNEEYYILNLDSLWKTYSDNFNELYPGTKLREKDVKTVLSNFRIDISNILIGKKLLLYNENVKIDDVWTRYAPTAYMLSELKFISWQYKFKINGKWTIIKDNNIKISKNPRIELEDKLEFLSTAEKYNL